MIYRSLDVDYELISGLISNNYSRRIKSHFAAYGVKYDFSSFYIIEKDGCKLGLISIFNGTMIAAAFKGKAFGKDVIKEIALFVRMMKPQTVQMEVCFAKRLVPMLKDVYYKIKRTEFAFCAKNKIPPLDVQELPKLDDVYDVLKTCFPDVRDNYQMWYADTSHRIRKGLAQTFLMGDYTTATIQYIVDGVALVGQVGTVEGQRGKHYARSLLYWIGEKLTFDGFNVMLFARPHRVSYYNEIGFKQVGTDIVLEKIKEKEMDK